MVEAAHSSATSVHFNQTTWRYIAEIFHLQQMSLCRIIVLFNSREEQGALKADEPLNPETNRHPFFLLSVVNCFTICTHPQISLGRASQSE
jgi:hypothetical protein